MAGPFSISGISSAGLAAPSPKSSRTKINLARIEAEHGQIEPDLRQRDLQITEFKREKLTVPATLGGKLIVCECICPKLGLRKVREADDRNSFNSSFFAAIQMP